MKKIELIVNIEIAKSRQNLLFQLLGGFGDRLSKDVQEEIRKEITFEKNVEKKLNKRLEKL